MERSLYESRLKAARDEYAQRKWAIKKGLMEGENRKAFDVARVLKAMGDSVDKIAKATGLSEQQIATL